MSGMQKARVFEAALVIILICLTGLLLLAVTSARPSMPGWERQANGTVDYMFVSSNDTLYTFKDNTISALRSDGSLIWRMEVPGDWKVSSDWSAWGVFVKDTGLLQGIAMYPVVAERSGHLYLFTYQRLTEDELAQAKADRSVNFSHAMELMAISPQGRIEWETSLGSFTVAGEKIQGMDRPELFSMGGIATLNERDGRLYLYREYREDVLDDNGTLLFTINNVSCPASVGDDGSLYVIPATRPSPEYNESFYENRSNDTVIIGEDVTRMIWDPAYLTSGSFVEAYGPDGGLKWSTDMGEKVVRQLIDTRVWPKYCSLPLYSNGTLYVPVLNGMATLNASGQLQWVRHLQDGVFIQFPLMPIDDQGNVYMSRLEYPLQTSRIVAIASNGTVSNSSWPYLMYDSYDSHIPGPVVVAGNDGVVYAYNSSGSIDKDSFNRTLRSKSFDADTITAYDIRSNTALWSFKVPAVDKHTLVLNKANAGDAGLGYQIIDLNGSGIVVIAPLDMYQVSPVGRGIVHVFPGANVTYLSYYYTIYEQPIMSNRSRCIYVNSLYALDDNGQMLWKQPMSGFIFRAAANNSSFYYSTDDGRIGGINAGIAAAGIAAAAIVYLFLRFFMLGTVARARGLIDKNENRRQLLRFVADNPGITAAEAARSLNLNLGTVRYHLFILALNHRVIAHSEGDKFMRYFTNAGAYSLTDRSLMSLMRRDTLRRTLIVLSRRPGITGPELARELNVSTTAAHRHISELSEKGIVERVADGRPGYAYAIKEEYRPHVERMAGQL